MNTDTPLGLCFPRDVDDPDTGFSTGDHRTRVTPVPLASDGTAIAGASRNGTACPFPRLPYNSAEPPGRRGEAGEEFVGLLRGVFGCGGDIFHIGSLSLRYFR